MDYGESSFRRGGFTLRKSNIMVAIVLMVAVFVGFMIWGLQMSGRDDSEGNDNPEKEASPIESSQNDTNQLLRQIEANTAKTAFWTKVVGVPVLIGLIIGALASMAQCS